MVSAFVLGRYTSRMGNFCNHDELNYPLYAYMPFFHNCEKQSHTMIHATLLFCPMVKSNLLFYFFQTYYFESLYA